MQKRFRKRVVLFSKDEYAVQYAYYYIFPIWHTLEYWFEADLLCGLERWFVNLWTYDKAVKVAKSLKTIEDVESYYAPFKEKETDFYKRKKEYLLKATLVKVQEII